MAIPLSELPKHKLNDLMDRLAENIRSLERENKALKKKVGQLEKTIEAIDRKARHGCYDANCPECDRK